MTDADWTPGTDAGGLIEAMAAVKARRGGGAPGGVPFGIYIMSNLTLNGLDTFIDFHGLAGGIDATVETGRFNVLYQDLINPSSPLYAAKPKLLVLALAWDAVAPDPGTPVEAATAELAKLFGTAAEKAGCPIAVNTFPLPAAGYDRAGADASLAGRIAAVNAWIRTYVTEHAADFFLCDWTVYQQDLGTAQALDDRYWFLARAPFRPAFLDRYGADIAKIARALCGLNKKVLVLDCDNTLWGGVLGEDGLDGIKLDRADYPGNVFYAVQTMALDLAGRGVLLAVCSKNNEADVIEAMTTHPHCLLKPEHFAAMRINWDNKADNLRALAETLNLGLDSFVFVDDSRFEIDMVRGQLPNVATFQVPDKPYKYPRALMQACEQYFYAASRTAEDVNRQALYQARQKATEAKAAFGDTESYLKSLNITLDVHPMTEAEVSRVAQLTGKTNQFNVAKQVFSEAEVRAMRDDPDKRVHVGVCADTFGDLGLTIVCMSARTGNGTAEVINFLMSCRVFERNLEYALLDTVCKDLVHDWGTGTLRARFVPSEKNAVCRDFFENAGFRLENERDGVRTFEVDLAARTPQRFDYIELI